jgi:hypothetical protein
VRRPLRLQRALPLLLALLAPLTAGCKAKNNGTLMLVEISSDIVALDEIQLTATPSRGKSTSQTFLLSTSKLPVHLALVPEGDPALDVELSVKGLSNKGDIASVVAVVPFQPGKGFTAAIFLSRDCRTKAPPCPVPQQCVAGGTCVAKAQAATIKPLGTTEDAGPPPPKPDLAVERPPRDSSAVSGSWTVVSPPAFMGNLNGVHPVSDKEVWVVGTGGALGFVYRYDGTLWTPVQLPLQTRPLQAVWAAGSEDVWAVGFGGTILHRVGGVFSAVPSGVTTNLAAVFGTSANDVWFVGAGQTVLHWDGTGIVAAGQGVTTDLTSGWATSATDVWLAGTAGSIYRRSGAGWQLQAQGVTTATLFGIWSSAAGEVWAVGDKVAVHHDGGVWTLVSVPVALGLGVWGAADNDVWVVGRGAGALARGITAHFDGNTWTEVTSPMSGALQAVRGVSAMDVWAVGKEVIRYR